MPTECRNFAGQSCLRCSVVLLGLALLYLLWVYGNMTTTFGTPTLTESPNATPCSCSPSNLLDNMTKQANSSPNKNWRLGARGIVGQLSHNDTIAYPSPAVRLVLVDQCLKKMNLPSGEQSYHLYDTTKIHVIYGIWLPAGHPLVHETVEPQLYEVYTSGLFNRPNTHVHIVLSTNSSDELAWFSSLALWQHIPNYEIIHNYWNMFEFPAIRTMWELACKEPDALYVYFHNKGARWGQGRLIHEKILTRQIILPWKSMLTLLMKEPSIPHVGVGGPGWQWMNFYWARGSYLLNSPIPIRSNDRFYYEYYIAKRADPGHCHLATGFAAAMLESPLPTPPDKQLQTSFGVGTCDTRRVDDYTILNTVLRTDRGELFGP